MKNTTVYRSNLSSERVAFLAELKAQREKQAEDSAPKTYKRQAKDKELDVLWSNFKLSSKDDKSPGLYLLTGFILGALSMFLINSLFYMNNNTEITDDIDAQTIKQSKIEKRINTKKVASTDVTIIPANTQPSEDVKPHNETYKVKSGDTLQGIVIRFYGKYSPAKAELIKEANGMTSVNKLSIGQELIIPIE